MAWVLRLVETGIDRPSRVIDVLDIRPRGDLGDIANLGLTLAEAKQILAPLQQTVVLFQGERRRRTTAVPSSRQLWRALREVDTYLRGQSSRLVNYARRYRAGLRVGTSMTEGTANFLVNRRMNKAQQMRWSRRSADLLLQVRCAVYNGPFGDGFGTLFDPTSNTVQKSPLAA
jgi:hypothetical protein